MPDPAAGVLPSTPTISVRQFKKAHKNPAALATLAGLQYVSSPLSKGFYRKGKSPRFYYTDETGHRVKDRKIIDRIKALALPPAWEEVWICTDTTGHLQATGIDQAGRKQYRYHSLWNQIRNQGKYLRLLYFSETLPRLRERISADLRKHNPDLSKSVALVIGLMDKTCIRVGNERYKVKHGSSGLSTMDARATTVSGKTIRFVFKGKKGVKQDIVLRNQQLARLVQQYKGMRGRRLFQYIDTDGKLRPVRANHINDYIREHTGGDFSAKDFRTWMGTVTAFDYLNKQPKHESKRQYTRTINSCLDAVATHLGNTRTVCRKYYVHPSVLFMYESNKLQRYQIREVTPCDYLSDTEQRVRLLLDQRNL
jgi:DNA topoisomerase I